MTQHAAPPSPPPLDDVGCFLESSESGFIDDDLFESPYAGDGFNPAGNLLLSPVGAGPAGWHTFPRSVRLSSVLPVPSDLDTSHESLAASIVTSHHNLTSSSESLRPHTHHNRGERRSKYDTLPSPRHKTMNSFKPIEDTAKKKNVKNNHKPEAENQLENNACDKNLTAKVETSTAMVHQNVRLSSAPSHSDSSNSMNTHSTKDSNSSSESLSVEDKFNTVVKLRTKKDSRMNSVRFSDNPSTKQLNGSIKLLNTSNSDGSLSRIKKTPPKPPPRTVTAGQTSPYAQTNIAVNPPANPNGSQYVGIGAKRKSFRIPAENFIEYHNPNAMVVINNAPYDYPSVGRQHAMPQHRSRKSDSIEKLESNEFMLSPDAQLAPGGASQNQIDTYILAAAAGQYHDAGSSSFNPSSTSSNRDSMTSSASSGSGSTSASNGSRPMGKKQSSLHYAATNIVSLPPRSQPGVHRTSKQDTSQALQSLRKRVQIVQDEASLKLLPYLIPADCSTKVTFPAATWDLMMQNFRIALCFENVFICDHFLGRDAALLLRGELAMLRSSGHFERHMQRDAQGGDGHDHAVVFLTEPDRSLPRIDGLVLMIYKLAHYYVQDWSHISVQIAYYPNGHGEEHSPKQESIQRFLKCVYFPTLPGEGSGGQLYVEQASGREVVVEPTFDRLLAFWGDTMSHRMEPRTGERFVINVWMVR